MNFPAHSFFFLLLFDVSLSTLQLQLPLLALFEKARLLLMTFQSFRMEWQACSVLGRPNGQG